ncbi:Type III pantothenate kinase [Candidatus Kinetoplastibacterium sorsogonicusi]|uniref:Type III pantothenate kinase n=1 Tax=Candidatus Kinetoplastidibacterium kentomonadis TaxID=1576550 RepID=A0A3Q8ES08_9PROT|nr:type III pantothenate kinase [Candidatus Kinetoplastibacterium sorsogonicusi]AWD32757.1 Type III pantothenate kinase [Candidatus Kinetoplastibacterium sorsogonicusi]
MIILLDLGNTRIKIGWIVKNNKKIYREKEVIIFNNNDYLSIRKWIFSLTKKPTHIFGSNVAGNAIGKIINNEFKKIGCNIHWLVPSYKKYKLLNKYLTPSQLGTDRWCSMLGIVNKLSVPHPPLLIISFGTATTIDSIDAINNFIGGLIIPGINTMKISLNKATNLPIICQSNILNFPKNTNQAISSGIIFSHSGTIIRQWINMIEQFHEPPTIYVTGGLWPEIKKELITQFKIINKLFNKNIKIIYKERAVLDGLYIIAEKYI